MLFYISTPCYFYFRPGSANGKRRGLNVYGAVTWGQFLFTRASMNIAAGYIPAAVDAADSYIEKVSKTETSGYMSMRANKENITKNNHFIQKN